METEKILDEVGKVEIVSDANVPWPATDTQPPAKIRQTVGGAEEWKLVYVCRYHSADQMRQLVHEQFASELFDQKGQSTTVQNYTVTTNPTTNQLIVRSPAEQDLDAVLEMLNEIDIPPVQVRVDCMVSELNASMTMDRETTLLIENLFGEGIALGGKDDGAGGVLPAFPGASLREPARGKYGLKVGVNRPDEGHRVQALVDILVSRGYLKVLMQPTLEVLNGQTAKVLSKQRVPLEQIIVQSGGYGDDVILSTQTKYYEVVDSLQITPHVFADGSISLTTHVQIASYLAPQGVTQSQTVTERTITSKDNRIRPGESLVIGGMRKTVKRDVIRGVPVLKDIPVLNLLFSGRDFEEQATELLFVLTPVISTKGRPNQDMQDMLERRHSSPLSQTGTEGSSSGGTPIPNDLRVRSGGAS